MSEDPKNSAAEGILPWHCIRRVPRVYQPTHPDFLCSGERSAGTSSALRCSPHLAKAARLAVVSRESILRASAYRCDGHICHTKHHLRRLPSIVDQPYLGSSDLGCSLNSANIGDDFQIRSPLHLYVEALVIAHPAFASLISLVKSSGHATSCFDHHGRNSGLLSDKVFTSHSHLASDV